MLGSQSKPQTGFFPRAITHKQAIDTGMAMVLISLLYAHLTHHYGIVPLSIGLLVISMTFPGFYRPLAWFWFGLSHILGTVMSKVLLTLAFFVVVTPVALIRKISGADTMQLTKWKRGDSSVFIVRDRKFTSRDMEKPY